ncbi:MULTISPECIES: ATP-binding protein [Shewanella]|uniref:ATP-binding protein n=1 Tax=Shewanella TaxID=22 RepID=UPI001C65F4DC|nr:MULTISPECIES: ATP-binding protein [Shewanella]QYJ76770.1 ATP-binding protein [Shewanella sp. FJAT-52076]QYK06686.1 ATP-binding protein [Shewanella zhangzhouensis]
MKKAIILRGLPGSGKSYWVKAFLASLPEGAHLGKPNARVFSTDAFFTKEGVYCFDAKKLPEYHQRNLCEFIEALAEGTPVVICDNTNLAHWEYLAYETAAKALGYEVEKVLIGTPGDRRHQALCAERNSHGVPLAAIRRMARTFQP